MGDSKRDLERQLRKNRPEPSADYLRLAVGKLDAETGVRSRSRDRGWIARPLFTLAAGAAVVVAFAALGGFSGLKASVQQNAHLSPFVAAANTYCAGETVTVSAAAGQDNPTTNPTINFSVDFGIPVTGFTNGDVVLGGTAGATTAVVSGGPQIYNVAVTGMTTAGTVTVTIPGHAATDVATGMCDSPASNTFSITYSKLTLTGYTEDGNSGNGQISGSGAAAGSVVVTVCKVNSFPCSTANTAATYTVTAAGDGTFATGQNKLAKGTTFYAQAVQGSVHSQVLPFSNI